MCPACLTTFSLIASSAISTGGLTALFAKKLRVKTDAKKINSTTRTRGEKNGTSENRVAS
jgi:NhaP-type Na+/H+ or K+/H+ antiporter